MVNLAQNLLSAVIATAELTQAGAAEAAHAAGAAAADAHAGGVQIASLEFALTIATWCAFGLLVLLLAKFGWGPFMKALDEREKKIAEAVKKAEAVEHEAEKLLAICDERMKTTREQAGQLLAEARQKAEAVASKIEDEGRKAAEDERNRAVAQIRSEREKAVAELNSIVATAAASLAGKLIQSEVDPKKHQKLIDVELERLGKLR